MDLFTILGKDQGNLILSKISGLAKKIIENYALEQSSQSQERNKEIYIYVS